MMRFGWRQALACCIVLAWADAGAVTPVEVEAGAAKLYRTRLDEARSRFELDTDAAFLARVQRIAALLIAQGGREHAEALAMAWEIHTTSDTAENASCMAGGKLLFGQPYVERLELNDGELAMLVAHEIAHALLQHNLKEMREALRLEPERAAQSYAELEYAVDHDPGLMRKLEAFDSAQELEADREGLILAVHAGWPAQKLADYFRKLVRHDPMPNADWHEHPAPSRRRQAAQALIVELGL